VIGAGGRNGDIRRAGTGALVAVAAAAAVVLVGALVWALLLRLHDVPSYPGAASGAIMCGTGACRLLATSTAGDGVAELFANSAGTNGHVKFTGRTGTSVFQTDVDQADVVLTTGSLSCVSGAVPVCLVSGEYADQNARPGALGEVFVRRGGYWRQPGSRFLYSSADSLVPAEGTGGGDPNVVTVQHDCGQATLADRQGRCAQPDVIIQLFAADGTSLGCTLPATSVPLLPGRGRQVPPTYDLHDCPASSG
jgi:hypothetical protein